MYYSLALVKFCFTLLVLFLKNHQLLQKYCTLSLHVGACRWVNNLPPKLDAVRPLLNSDWWCLRLFAFISLHLDHGKNVKLSGWGGIVPGLLCFLGSRCLKLWTNIIISSIWSTIGTPALIAIINMGSSLREYNFWHSFNINSSIFWTNYSTELSATTEIFYIYPIWYCSH